MTKTQLDKELKELRRGFKETELGDAAAFDIAESILLDSKIKEAIKKHYPRVTDLVGFVANHIC